MSKCHKQKQCPPVIIVSQPKCREKRHEHPFRVNRTVFVDQHFGDDFTGKRTYPEKPFKTILAALSSSKDGDTIWIRASNLPSGSPPGPYVQDIILPMSNILTSIKFYLEPDVVLQSATVALFQVSGSFSLEVDGNGTLSGNGLTILSTGADFTGNVVLKANTYLGSSTAVASVVSAKELVVPTKPSNKKERRQLASNLKSKSLSRAVAPLQPLNYLFQLNSVGGVIKIQGLDCQAGAEGILVSAFGELSGPTVYYQVVDNSSDFFTNNIAIGSATELYLTSDHIATNVSFNLILVNDTATLHFDVKKIENPAGSGLTFGDGTSPASVSVTGHVQELITAGNGINVTNPTDGFNVDLDVDQLAITSYNSGIVLNNSLAVTSNNYFKYRGNEINIQQGGFGVLVQGPINADFDVIKVAGSPGEVDFFNAFYAIGSEDLAPAVTLRSNHIESNPPNQTSFGVAIETASNVVVDIGTIVGFGDGIDILDASASGSVGAIVDCQFAVSLENANTVANGGLPITANLKVGTIRSSLDNVLACGPGPFFDVDNRIALSFELIDLTGRGASTPVSNTYGIVITEQAFVPVVESHTVLNIRGNYLGAINPITTTATPNLIVNFTGLFPNEQINFDFELCDAVVPLGGAPKNTVLITGTQSLVSIPPPNVSFRGKYRAGFNDVINTDIPISLSNSVLVNAPMAGLHSISGSASSVRAYGTPVATNPPVGSITVDVTSIVSSPLVV